MPLVRLRPVLIAIVLALGLPAEAAPAQTSSETDRLNQACNDGRGDVGACSDYGHRLYNAVEASKDHATALRLFQSSCDRGSAEACANAGIALRWSDVIPPDYPRALQYFERACESSNGPSCLSVGYMRRDGIGTSANAELARQAFNRACLADQGDACLQEGRMWLYGQGINKNEGLAYGSFLTGCALSDLGACTMKGLMIYSGQGGLAQNAELALKEFRRGCRGEVELACQLLASIREGGPGTLGYSELAASDAAELAIPSELPQAERMILAGYAFGEGKTNMALAAFEALAEEGMGEAAFTLGQIYYNGQNVMQDRRRAVRLFDQAARDGHPFASFLMGQFYWSGEGVRQDRSRGVVLMRAAGAGGITEADPIWQSWETELAQEEAGRQARLDQRFADTVAQARQNQESQRQADAANMARIWSLYAERQAQADEGQVCALIYSGGRANRECMSRERFDRYYNPAY